MLAKELAEILMKNPEAVVLVRKARYAMSNYGPGITIKTRYAMSNDGPGITIEREHMWYDFCRDFFHLPKRNES